MYSLLFALLREGRTPPYLSIALRNQAGLPERRGLTDTPRPGIALDHSCKLSRVKAQLKDNGNTGSPIAFDGLSIYYWHCAVVYA